VGVDAASDDVRRDAFATFRRPVDAVGGTEVKTQSDGLMAVFGTLDDAVRCGLAMLRGIDGLARRDPEVHLAIRVGVSSGAATHEEDHWFGPPVVEAAHLCSAAGSGELYAPSRIADVARAGWLVEPVGALELKGLPRRSWAPPRGSRRRPRCHWVADDRRGVGGPDAYGR
jgi:class 3 adenylate cyclase